MTDFAEYKFRTTQSPDGTLRYFVNDTELQDKAAYDRIKQRTDETMTKVFNEKSPEEEDLSKSMEDFKRGKKRYAKGGKINLSDCKVNTAQKNKSSSNW